MPFKCCVPGCRANYNSSVKSVSTFSFPKDPELVKVWLRLIRREDYEPTSSSRVCIKHFEDHYIVKVSSAMRDDGSLLVVPRKIFVLTKDAVPTIFENEYSMKRRKTQHSTKSKSRSVENLNKKKIESFTDFQHFVFKNCPLDWIYAFSDEAIILLKLDLRNCPNVFMSVKIFNDFSVEIFRQGELVPVSEYAFLLENTGKCDTYSKYKALFMLIEKSKQFSLSQETEQQQPIS